MAGATAATAAGVTASQVSGITINLTGNYISGADGNHLNADLTGDGHPDLTIANAFHFAAYFSGTPTQLYGNFHAGADLNGIRAYAKRTNNGIPFYGTERLGSRVATYFRGTNTTIGTYQLTGSIPIFFKDLHINGGAPTEGLLEVTVGGLDARIQLDSFTYNTPVQGSTRLAAVPDQGSSLALLAMGAGGILALRRWRAAETRS